MNLPKLLRQIKRADIVIMYDEPCERVETYPNAAGKNPVVLIIENGPWTFKWTRKQVERATVEGNTVRIGERQMLELYKLVPAPIKE